MNMCVFDLNSSCMLSGFLADLLLIRVCACVHRRQCSHYIGASLKLSRESSHAMSENQLCAPTYHVHPLNIDACTLLESFYSNQRNM